jgi:hypothetical protein
LFLYILGYPIQERDPGFHKCHFSAPKEDGDFYAILVIQEFLDISDLETQVMVVGVGPEFNLFQL